MPLNFLVVEGILTVIILSCLLVSSCSRPVVHIDGTNERAVRAITDSPEVAAAISDGAKYDAILHHTAAERFAIPLPRIFPEQIERHQKLVRNIKEHPSVFIRQRTPCRILSLSRCRCTDKPTPTFYYMKVGLMPAQSHAENGLGLSGFDQRLQPRES